MDQEYALERKADPSISRAEGLIENTSFDASSAADANNKLTLREKNDKALIGTARSMESLFTLAILLELAKDQDNLSILQTSMAKESNLDKAGLADELCSELPQVDRRSIEGPEGLWKAIYDNRAALDQSSSEKLGKLAENIQLSQQEIDALRARNRALTCRMIGTFYIDTHTPKRNVVRQKLYAINAELADLTRRDER